MTHDPERDAAAYLGGTLRARRRRRFEEHLIGCEDCWAEVEAGRAGRHHAESMRTLAPSDLRETVRAAIAAVPARPRRTVVWRAIVPAFALLLAGVVVTVETLDGRQPASVARAIVDFQQERMPSEDAAQAEAPDLTPLGLILTTSAWGHLDGLGVDAFSYRDTRGKRLLLYLSETPFPVASGARQAAPNGPWRASVGSVELLCSQEPHALLAVSDDALLLDAIAAHLEIVEVPA